MTEDLANLLLQAAGRAGKSQSRPSNPRWNSGGSSSDGFDDDSDSDAAPGYSRKKRHQPEKGGRRAGGRRGDDDDDEDDDDGRRSGGEDSDSVPSVGSDLYKDEEDREKLEKMSELDRELILAERSARVNDYKLKQMVRSVAGNAGARKDSSPPPLPSRMQSSTWADKLGSATKSALDELRAKRMRRQDPEAYHDRFKDLLPQSGSPSRCRAGSPPSDVSSGGSLRLVRRKQEKDRQKSEAYGGGCKEAIQEMIETKKQLAVDKDARRMDIKAIEERKVAIEEHKMAIEERKAAIEECKVAIEEEMLRMRNEKALAKKKVQDQKIMFMDTSPLDDTQKAYVEAMRAQIVAEMLGGGGSRNRGI